MINKTIAIIFLTAAASLAAFAQTPEPKARVEPRSFAFTFGGDGGYLGVETVDVSNENYGKYGLSRVRGVAIERVIEGSPAAAAGLLAGDVIVRINDEDVTSARKLTRLIGEIAPDHTAKVWIVRAGSERDIDVTIGKRPAPTFDNAVLMERLEKYPEVPAPPGAPIIEGLPRVFMEPGEPGKPLVWTSGSRRQIGVGVTTLTKQLSEHFGVEGGAMVNNVRDDSPAFRAGLRAGDIIVEAEGKPIKSDHDLIRAIAEKKEGDVSVTFVRDRDRQTVNVTPEASKGSFDSFFEFKTAPNPPGALPAPDVLKLARPAVPAAPALVEGLFRWNRVI